MNAGRPQRRRWFPCIALMALALSVFSGCTGGASETPPSGDLSGPVVPTRAVAADIPLPPTMPAANQPAESFSTPEALTIGDSVTGRIAGSVTEQRYQFAAEAGDIVTLRMRATSGDLDSLLILEGPDGQEIARNDDEDSRTSLDAGLVDVLLPASGLYTVVATRFNPVVGTTEGDFLLTIAPGIPVETTPETTASTGSFTLPDTPEAAITPGESLTATLDNIQTHRLYTLEVVDLHPLRVTMNATAGDLDPLLILLGPQGEVVARNDNAAAGDTNAAIGPLTLDAAGTYTIVATRFRGRIGTTTGSFSLTVETVATANGSTSDISTVSVVTLGNTIAGRLDDTTPRQMFTFSARAGSLINLITAAADPAALDTFMVLYDALGNEITRNDDNLFTGSDDLSLRSAAILNQPVPRTGHYLLVVTRFGRGAGDYALTLSLEARSPTRADALYLGVVDPDVSYGRLGDGARIAWVAAGDWLPGTDIDVTVEGLMTIHLPPLPPGARPGSAILDMSTCLLSGTNVFATHGPLTIYLNDTFTNVSHIAERVIRNAPAVATLSDCEVVDISDSVAEAYAEGATIMQFRLAFNGDTLLPNAVTDAAIFPFPRLEIFLSEANTEATG